MPALTHAALVLLALGFSPTSVWAGNVTSCKTYETPCGNICCNDFTQTCYEIPLLENRKMLICGLRYGELDRETWPTVLFLPILFTPLLLMMSCWGVKAGIMNCSVGGWVSDVMVLLGGSITFFAIPLVFTPLAYTGLVVGLMGMATIGAACSLRRNVRTVVLVLQVVTFLLWSNPFNANFLLGTSSDGGVLGQLSKFRTEAATPLKRTPPNNNTNSEGLEGSIAPPGNDPGSCVNFYDHYFTPNLQDLMRGNPEVPTWGFCGLGWLTAVSFFAMFDMCLNALAIIYTFIHWGDLSERDSPSRSSRAWRAEDKEGEDREGKSDSESDSASQGGQQQGGKSTNDHTALLSKDEPAPTPYGTSIPT